MFIKMFIALNQYHKQDVFTFVKRKKVGYLAKLVVTVMADSE